MSTISDKGLIRKQYESYISLLEDTSQSIRGIKGKYEQFSSIQNDVLDVLDALVEDSKKQMRETMNGTVWDKLVIAFFGETGAGKSTIIETFRVLFQDKEREEQRKANQGEGVDGLIVGDGQSDFTKVYHEYDLEIDGKPFVLIDVPGIEGKESDYIDEITTALKQAHCVFYVQGENQPPDAKIAEKIGRYLSDWVEVYSIWNIRSAIADYLDPEDRVRLLSEKNLKTEDLIKGVLTDAIGDVYKGHISLQALMALNAVGDFHVSRKDLLKSQRKLFQIFESSDDALEFCHFKDLVLLVDEKCDNFSSQIIRSNQQKMQGLQKRIRQSISNCVSSKTDELDGFAHQLKAFKNGIKNDFTNTNNTIRNDFRSIIDRSLNTLLSQINKEIDGDGKHAERKKRIEVRISNCRNSIRSAINESISNISKQLEDKIELKRKDLEEYHSLSRISFPKQENLLDLNIDEILSNLDFNILRDGLKVVLNALTPLALVGGGFALGTPGGPVGQAIGAGVGALLAIGKAIFVKPDDGRSKAKQKAREVIRKSKEDMVSKMDDAAQDIKKKFDVILLQYTNPINKEIDSIGKLKEELENIETLVDL